MEHWQWYLQCKYYVKIIFNSLDQIRFLHGSFRGEKLRTRMRIKRVDLKKILGKMRNVLL